MLTVAQARARILAAVPQGAAGIERVTLPAARGRVLGERITSAFDWPRFSHAAMDGAAVRFADATPGARLRVVSTRTAGQPSGPPIGPGEAARVMTGATLPNGADTVIMREHLRFSPPSPDDPHNGDGFIEVVTPPKAPGQWIRTQGEDARAGALLAEPGALIDAGLIGALASQGRAQVAVFCRPRVAVLTTGDELVEIDQTPGPGQVINSTSYALAALIEDAGGAPWVLPKVPDDLHAIEAALRLALRRADLVLTVGGVSVGDRDLVKEAMTRAGVGLTDGQGFWRVAMRPGKPLAFGAVQGVPVLGLPGNPVSSFVTALLFARPAIARLGGRPTPDADPTVPARLIGRPIAALPDRAEYARGWLRAAPDGLTFEPCVGQASGNLLTVATTNALAVLPPNHRADPDASISCLPFGPLLASP